ncbi:MAG TPA: serine/threonine protein kinase [Rhodocyclaceae bacterium]|jgi:Ser/Thr protein kinase RdoA (MazF antagonist)|nr:serine/threonine protein kinase [Rhodocyclaceae bacterium]
MNDNGNLPGPDAFSFASLTPDHLLDALESVGLRPDGRLLALNSFENRVYQVGIEDEHGERATPLIAKFYRPARWSDAQILEEHTFTQTLVEYEIPVVPPLSVNGATLHHFGDVRFALFPRQSGRAPELDDADTLRWMGRFLGRIHAVGALTPFLERPAIDRQSFGVESRDWLLAHDAIPLELMAAWSSVADQALDLVGHCYERAGHVETLRLHGDCHMGNVLWLDRGDKPGPYFVDFDDSRMGPAIQDLWMLLAGDNESASVQLAHVLEGYEQFREFDDRELHLIEALRTLRLLHYSAWLARRWDDPAFPVAFPWFGTARYWQERILELREQVALMQEAPLRPARL